MPLGPKKKPTAPTPTQESESTPVPAAAADLPVVSSGRVVTKTEHTYTEFREVFPRESGPPYVRNNTGGDVLSDTSHTVTTTMDAGAYRAIWELVEAETKRRWDIRNSIPSAGAYVRALKALREGWWTVHSLEDAQAQRPQPTPEEKPAKAVKKAAKAPKKPPAEQVAPEEPSA